METKVGLKGEIIIPEELRKKLGIKPETKVKIGIKDKEIFIRKDEDFVKWLKERVKKYGMDLSKVNLKKVYESQFEEKWKNSEIQA